MAAYYPPGGSQAVPEQPGTAPGQGYGSLDQGYRDAGQGSQGYRNAGPRDLLTSPPPGGRGKAVIAALAAVAVLAAGGGVAFWLTHRHQAGNSAPSAQAGASGSGSQGSSGPSSPLTPTPTPAPTPTPTPTPTPVTTPASSGSILTVAPGVAQEPHAPQVESYVISYFTAINNHSYQQYLALLDRKMRRDESPQKFFSGFHSTTDSRAVLSAISSIGRGRVGAALTFTSHQLPADSPSKTACTDWSITLYLRKQGGRYVLGHSPPGYQAVYQAC